MSFSFLSGSECATNRRSGATDERILGEGDGSANTFTPRRWFKPRPRTVRCHSARGSLDIYAYTYTRVCLHVARCDAPSAAAAAARCRKVQSARIRVAGARARARESIASVANACENFPRQLRSIDAASSLACLTLLPIDPAHRYDSRYFRVTSCGPRRLSMQNDAMRVNQILIAHSRIPPQRYSSIPCDNNVTA